VLYIEELLKLLLSPEHRGGHPAFQYGQEEE